MEEIQGWLGDSSFILKNPSPPPRREQPVDELGPPTGKWDYHHQDGTLLVCVYRYDPPDQKKQFRPWDVKTRKWQAPSINRPLYNLPGIMSARHVVLVEGEKAAESLIINETKVQKMRQT